MLACRDEISARPQQQGKARLDAGHAERVVVAMRRPDPHGRLERRFRFVEPLEAGERIG
jgi:hypothetical protein